MNNRTHYRWFESAKHIFEIMNTVTHYHWFEIMDTGTHYRWFEIMNTGTHYRWFEIMNTGYIIADLKGLSRYLK
jgi:hypothetical protein